MKRRLVAASSIVVLLMGVFVSRSANADEEALPPVAKPPDPPGPWATRPSVMSGLGQWIVFGGGNIAGQLKVGRFVFEYSHGQALDYDRLGGFAKTSAERDANVSVFSPWTTGGGVGIQITPRLHALIEVKAHRYEIQSTEGAAGQQRLAYTTFSVGPGVFYDIYLYKGLFVQPNVRFWPNVANTLSDSGNKIIRADGSTYSHDAHNLGFFANINVGWTFTGI